MSKTPVRLRPPPPFLACRRISTTEIEKAYLAGLVDGEGSITLSRAHRNEMPSPELTITNTCQSLVEWVKQITNCGLIISRSPRRPHHKPAFVWSVGKTDKCLNLLQEIRPYLRVKDRQADLLLNRYKASTPRNGKYTPAVLEEKLRLVEEIRVLNRRCSKPVTNLISEETLDLTVIASVSK